MAMVDNAYSRFVQIAKIALPLLALSLLSTLFLLSRSINPEDAIPFADIDVEQIAKEQSLAAPKFSGVTSDGSTISVSAEQAQPDLTNPRRLSAVNVVADILTTGGTQILVLSDTALYDGESNLLDLSGRVRFNTSTGFELQTEAMQADLEVTRLTAPGPVEGFGPGGTLNAGSMELTGVSGAQLLHFKNGVKLVYGPRN